jgi:polyadenylate-binding protein
MTTPQTRPTTGSLYVGDLEPSVQEETLNQVFKQVGPISSIRVCRDSQTRVSLGYAYVNFHNLEDAERALNLLNYQTSIHGGKPWRIMWSHRDPSIRKSGVGNIFIKNLHRDINQQQLFDLFSSFGNILSCKVALDDHGRSKGYGFIHFETKEAAEKAIESTNTLFFENKPVYVGPFIPSDKRQRNNPEDIFTNIYIKDIDETTTEEEYNELVSACGTATSVKLILDNGKAKGFGFANYKTHEEAKNAVANLNGKKWKSKALTACRAMKKQEREDSLRKLREERKKAYELVNLYIKNLDESFTPEKLQEEFSKYGQITSLKVMNSETGASKGFGFVCYANKEQAKNAIDSLNGQQFGNKNLYVSYFQPREERRQHLQMQHASRAFRHPYYPPPYSPVPTPPFGAIPPRGAYPPYSRQGYPQPVPFGGPKRPTKPRGPNNFPQGVRPGGAPGGKRPNQPKPAPVEVPSLSSLAAYPPAQRRQIIGDHLYQLILSHKADSSLAGSLTGIILHSYKDHDDSELISLLDDPNELKNQMEEAFNTLEKGRAQQ